jgi:hypothetical protein
MNTSPSLFVTIFIRFRLIIKDLSIYYCNDKSILHSMNQPIFVKLKFHHKTKTNEIINSFRRVLFGADDNRSHVALQSNCGRNKDRKSNRHRSATNDTIASSPNTRIQSILC